MRLSDYDYFLPEKNLALKPASPRDSSKLFVYNTKKDNISFDYFYNLDKYLSKNSFLVLNQTKVLPARVEMIRFDEKTKKHAKVIVLFLVNEQRESKKIKAMVDRKVKIGEILFFNKQEKLKVVGQNKNIFDLGFDFSQKKLFALLKRYGKMPIPLYLRKTPLKDNQLKERYQTIFGEKEGSVAAPTASLHFTERVFKKLENKGIQKFFVTLHVGLGTFAPITEENLKTKKLHEEYYEIKKETWEEISQLKNQGKKLVAVGTTVVRTLESEARHRVFSLTSPPQSGGSPKSLTQKQVSSLKKTNLFIIPPYDFQMVDILITNFHLPKSSLMMLVEAFLQHKKAKKHLVELYNIAIKNNFRFYSFGDAMLII